MLALFSLALLCVGFVVTGLGEFRKNIVARRIGLGLVVPSVLLAVFLLVVELSSGIDLAFLACLSMIAAFVVSIIGETKDNRKLRITGLLLQLPMIILGFFIVVLMMAFSHI